MMNTDLYIRITCLYLFCNFIKLIYKIINYLFYILIKMDKTTTIIASIVALFFIIFVFWIIYKSGNSQSINKSGKNITKSGKSNS